MERVGSLESTKEALTMFDLWPFPELLSSFFSLIESEILEQASRQVTTEEPNKGF